MREFRPGDLISTASPLGAKEYAVVSYIMTNDLMGTKKLYCEVTVWSREKQKTIDRYTEIKRLDGEIKLARCVYMPDNECTFEGINLNACPFGRRLG